MSESEGERDILATRGVGLLEFWMKHVHELCSLLDDRMQSSHNNARRAFQSGSYDVGGMVLTTFVCGRRDFVDFVELASTLARSSPQFPPGTAGQRRYKLMLIQIVTHDVHDGTDDYGINAT